MTLFTVEAIQAVVAAVESGVAEGTTCSKVAAEVGLDPEIGATVVSYLLKSGAVPGYETRKRNGIVPAGYVSKAAGQAAEKAEKAAKRAAELAAKAAKAQAAADAAKAKLTA